MKRSLLLVVFFITTLCARAQFTAGNLVVSKINISGGQTTIVNADDATNGYYAVLQEITPAGANVGSAIALPNLVLDGRSVAYEGEIGLSQDNKSISIIGFNGGVKSGSATFRANSKMIYRLDSQKTFGTVTNILASDFAGNAYRNAYRNAISADGSSFLIATGIGTPPYRTINYGANNPSGTTMMTAVGLSLPAGQSIRNFTYNQAGLYGSG
ncbi:MULTISPECIES: hypothetical protein [unclassified Flavobacterium]|jgi:hypothetical protein|uniref:hypothetical protein n=1 Tax=unclassified Flavobacterium TaxID=196869 RepID=UPI0025BBCCDF|nr:MULTISPECIES: hypothetical protein [unclassified Flavobacterium]